MILEKINYRIFIPPKKEYSDVDLLGLSELSTELKVVSVSEEAFQKVLESPSQKTNENLQERNISILNKLVV
jgi:hypothetical protein